MRFYLTFVLPFALTGCCDESSDPNRCKGRTLSGVSTSVVPTAPVSPHSGGDTEPTVSPHGGGSNNGPPRSSSASVSPTVVSPPDGDVGGGSSNGAPRSSSASVRPTVVSPPAGDVVPPRGPTSQSTGDIPAPAPTGPALPSWVRPIQRAPCRDPVAVLGPAWERPGYLGPPQNVARLRANQQRYLAMFREAVAARNWDRIHNDHFDWWQFPCDFGSQTEFNLKSEQDIQNLLADPAWHADYLESVRLVSRAFGWDIDSASLIADDSGGRWRPDKDIRLAKIIRSLWLFGETRYFESLRSFARIIQENIYRGGAFLYAGRCYDEIVIMTLPRPIPFH